MYCVCFEYTHDCVCCYCVRMDDVDDDSCVMKYIGIVPLDNFDSTDVNFDPDNVKVCVFFLMLIINRVTESLIDSFDLLAG